MFSQYFYDINYAEDKYSNELSRLGFGCMRFQRNAGVIDIKEAEREILHAIDLGVNCFDMLICKELKNVRKRFENSLFRTAAAFGKNL